MTITRRLNLTQHASTPDQECLEPLNKGAVQRLLTFDSLPDRIEIEGRANALADIAKEAGAHEAMIGGAPYLMGPLEAALLRLRILPLYAFSVRSSEDQPQADGTVKKVAVFKHAGFIPVWGNCQHLNLEV